MTGFAEHLITPHMDILKKGGPQPEFLTESTRLETIQAAYRVSDRKYDDQVEAAYSAAHLVRDTLRFQPYERTDSWLSPEEVTLTQRTNCHGYSIVLSETLESIGVPHYVSFANGHSFILLQSKDGSHTNFIDAPVKEFYANIDGGIDAPALGKQIADGTSAVGVLDTKVLMERSSFFERDKERAVHERPWINFATNQMYRTHRPQEDSASDSRIILRAYSPGKGREVLNAYGNFVLAMRRDKFDIAHEKLQPLDGEYPEIDSRNRFREPTRLVRALGRKGEIAKALKDIEIVERSLWGTDNLLVHLWPSDERRRIGVAAGQAALIGRSIEEYGVLLEQRAQAGLTTDAVRSRLTKAKAQWSTVKAA